MKLRTSISFWCLKMKIYPAGSVLGLPEGVIDLNKLQGDLFFSTRHFFSDFRLGAVKKHGCFCDLWFCFRCSSSTADFMTLLADEITRAFNRVGDTQAVAHNVPKDLDMFFLFFMGFFKIHAGFLRKLKIMEFQVRYLALFFYLLVISW